MIKLKISTQSYENKAYYEGGESWRPKGEFVFFTKIDSMDAIMCPKEVLISSIKELISNQCNDLDKFEYRSHELIFQDYDIPEEELQNIIDKKLNTTI
tara:strand:- start:169 stop:462 length:294 start_codon:yes stop_codon:yes gene_type:complete